MDDDILKLSTKTSVYDPIEIEIDGNVYRVKSLSNAVFKKMNDFEPRARRGNMDALYSQVKILLDAPEKLIDNLDVRDVRKIINHIIKKIYQVKETEEQKKVTGPGENATQE